MSVINSRYTSQPVLSEKEILKQLSTINACDKRIAVLTERENRGHMIIANAKAKEDRAKELEAIANAQIKSGRAKTQTGQMKIDSGRIMQESGRALQTSGQTKIDLAQIQIDSAQMKIDSAQMKIESGRAMQTSGQTKIDLAQVQIESGRAMQASAQIKMDQVTAMREKECREIYEEMDSAIEQLKDKKIEIEGLKNNSEKGKIIEELNCLIIKAIQLKAEAKPTASLAPVNEKINAFGEECENLFEKLENII